METDTASETSMESPPEPVHVESPSDFDELTGEHDVVLADFYADWCGPCKAIEPVVERVADDTDAAVAKVDVDVHQQLAQAYGVRGVPTLVLFADGEEVDRIVGAAAEQRLRALIAEYTE